MSKKRKASAKQQTVAEFKAWLAGIMEFQPKDWCPNAAQWKAIQDKLNNLKEEIIINQQSSIPMTNPNFIPPNNQTNIPTIHPPTGSSFSDARNGQVMQMLPEEGGVPADVIVIPDQIPQATQRPSIETISSKVVASGGKKFKTPTDLSGKPYKSGFT